MQNRTRIPASRGSADDLEALELDRLLREIEKEAVPDRLLDLARQLQSALVEKRRREGD